VRSLSLLFLAAALAALLGCSGDGGPAGVLPGSALAGESATPPGDWSFAGDAGTMQLETHPTEPYSVNLAYTIVGGRFYVNAGGTETQWARNIALDANVRLRLDDRVYDLRARRVDDPAEIDAFAEAWTAQSFFRRDPRGYDEVWLYELRAR